MSYVLEKLKKINEAYAGEDCAQIMVKHQIPYLSIIGDEVIYNAGEGREVTINEYLKDLRRLSFPYARIPSHREKRGKVIFNYVNQIYEYDKPYIVLRDRVVDEQFVTRSIDKKHAIIVNRTLNPIFKGAVFDLTHQELTKELEKIYNEQEGEKFIFSNGGYLISKEDLLSNRSDNNYIIITSNGNKKTVTGLKIEINRPFYDLKKLDFHVHDYKGSDLRRDEYIAPIILEPRVPRIYNSSIPRENVIKARTMALMKNK